MPEGEKTARNFTHGSLGEVAEVGERAAVDSVVCVCRIKAPQQVSHMSEVKANVTD